MVSMNKLANEKRTAVIAALVEGNSIRATVRMTGVAKNTVAKLLVEIGQVCSAYHDKHVRNVKARRIQCDEIWSFCYAKQKNVPAPMRGVYGYGDVWTWTAIEADSKLAISYLVGLRDAGYATEFMHDLAGRLQRRSVAENWGRKPLARVRLSWTVNTTSLDEIEPLMEQGRKRGYRHFNVKIAPDMAFDLQLCRRVRKLAPDAFLWADANGGYNLETALKVAPRLADIGVNVFEQPIAANRLTGFRELKKQGALPILLQRGDRGGARRGESGHPTGPEGRRRG